MRDESIAVTAGEKKSLDTAAEELFGTTEVPYGAVISALANQYNDTNEDTVN